MLLICSIPPAIYRMTREDKMTRFAFRITTEPQTRFTEETAQSMIGQRPRINVRESEDGSLLADFGQGEVVTAEVIEDGAAVMVTVESDAAPVSLPDNMPPMSFGFSA